MSLDDTRSSKEYHQAQSLKGAYDREEAKDSAVRVAVEMERQNGHFPTRSEMRAAGVPDKAWRDYYGTWREFKRLVDRFGSANLYSFTDDLADLVVRHLCGSDLAIRRRGVSRVKREKNFQNALDKDRENVKRILSDNHVVYGG